MAEAQLWQSDLTDGASQRAGSSETPKWAGGFCHAQFKPGMVDWKRKGGRWGLGWEFYAISRDYTLAELAQRNKGLGGRTDKEGQLWRVCSEELRPLICTPCTSAMMSSNMTSPLPLILPDT